MDQYAELKARGVFLAVVGEAFGGTRVFRPITRRQDGYGGPGYDYPTSGEVGAYSLMMVAWTNDRDPAPISTVVIIPTGPFAVLDGFTVTYSFNTFREDSETGGNETSVEVYATTEGGVSMPIPIAVFSAKAGERISTKTFKRSETKTATSAGSQISKSYLVQKVRHVMVFGPARFVATVTDEIGFSVQRKDVGDTVGPFWPSYDLSGAIETDSARKQADAAVDELIKAAAAELATRYGH